MIVCESSVKPLMLFHLVHTRSVTNALIFTKSAESTTRLVRLFEFFENSQQESRSKTVVARAYSSDLAPGERKSILEQFKNQDIQMYACSRYDCPANHRLTGAMLQTRLLRPHLTRYRHQPCLPRRELRRPHRLQKIRSQGGPNSKSWSGR